MALLNKNHVIEDETLLESFISETLDSILFERKLRGGGPKTNKKPPSAAQAKFKADDSADRKMNSAEEMTGNSGQHHSDMDVTLRGPADRDQPKTPGSKRRTRPILTAKGIRRRKLRNSGSGIKGSGPTKPYKKRS